MPEDTTRKPGAIALTRIRSSFSKIIYAKGFRLRIDKEINLIDIFLELPSQRGERIMFDPIIVGSNLGVLKDYVASSKVEPDDSSVRSEILVTDQPTWANSIHTTWLGNRGETIFGLFSMIDFATESRTAAKTGGLVESVDVVVIYSSSAMQKKLILDLISAISDLATLQ